MWSYTSYITTPVPINNEVKVNMFSGPDRGFVTAILGEQERGERGNFLFKTAKHAINWLGRQGRQNFGKIFTGLDRF